MLTALQVRILKYLAPAAPGGCDESISTTSKLKALLDDDLLHDIAGKTVIDFGCGEGSEAIELAQHGAGRVIGIDIREELLQIARHKARATAVAGICEFTDSTREQADMVFSIDAFEHFDDPAGILSTMDTLLKDHGEVIVSFGPTWYHPLGGHLFSVFPWAHLIFSEEALIRWRSGFKTDGATRFREVAGGLNQMTIKRFERIVAESPFEFITLELVPIKKLRHFHNHFTREFTTALVRCRLVKRAAA
jgi:SAM-dependent methyltransferase